MGYCTAALLVGQENALLIVFEVCKARRGTPLISLRRCVALAQRRPRALHTGRQEPLDHLCLSSFLLGSEILLESAVFGVCLCLSLGKRAGGGKGKKINHYLIILFILRLITERLKNK